MPPSLKSLGQETTFADAGDLVRMTLQTHKTTKLRWMFEAQYISEIPDDPTLAFESKTDLNGTLIQSLVISDVSERHYGVYEVTSENEGCIARVKFYIKHPAGRLIYLMFSYFGQ